MSAIKTIIINRGPAAPGGGASGTVTSVSVTASNGVSAVVATETTTPALTFTLGAITPASVAASGTVTGSNLSGVNTGDQDLSGLTVKSANLSDLTNSATARINLGLGTAAVAAIGDFATAAQGSLAASAIQPAELSSGISDHASAADPHGDRAYADSLVIGLVDDRGNFDGSINTFPTTGGSGTAGAILKGDLWTLSVVASSGPLVGSPVGSLVRALVDTPGQTAGNWSIVAVGFGYSPENAANKSTSLAADQASSVKYPTVKSVYDWATGLFATIASLAGYVPITRTVNGSPLSANVTVTSVTGNAGTVTGLSVTAGKTLTASNTITLAGTDGSTLSIGTGGTLGTAAFTAASAYATAAQGTDERVPTAAGLTSKFATNKATLVAGDKMALLDSAASDVPNHATLTAVFAFIKSVIDTGQTWAGLQQFSTRPRSSAALTPANTTELVTLADSRRLFAEKLRTLVYPLNTTWGSSIATGASYTAGAAADLRGANGTTAGALAIQLTTRIRVGVSPPNSSIGKGSIDFGNPIAANFAFSTFNFNLATGLNWAFLVGATETLASGIANMVKTGTGATIGWVGLQCINGNVTIIAVNGTSAVGESGVIDTCISGVNQKAYRIEVAAGTANVYSSTGGLLGSLSTNVPTVGKELVSPAILIDALETTNAIGMQVHLASVDW